jgi:hypothetical protein
MPSRAAPLAVLACLALVACAPGAPSAPVVPQAAGDAPSDGPLYSPFVVEVEASPFDVISFKDVGMSLPAPDRSLAYESLAEGLALELRERQSRVRYEEDIRDPANHVACAGRHIYVDLWSNAERLGYSLWSGCGEDDRFDWRELERQPTIEADVDELSRAIATSLDTAIETGCFTRRC